MLLIRRQSLIVFGLSLLLVCISFAVVHFVSPLRDPTFQPNSGNAGSLLPIASAIREDTWVMGAHVLAALMAASLTIVLWVWSWPNHISPLQSEQRRQTRTVLRWSAIALATLITYTTLLWMFSIWFSPIYVDANNPELPKPVPVYGDEPASIAPDSIPDYKGRPTPSLMPSLATARSKGLTKTQAILVAAISAFCFALATWAGSELLSRRSFRRWRSGIPRRLLKLYLSIHWIVFGVLSFSGISVLFLLVLLAEWIVD